MDPVTPAELAAGRVHLRPWGPDDVDAFWAAQRDPAIRQWAGGADVHTREDALAVLRRLTGQADRLSWAVVDPATGGLLGSITLYRIDAVQATAQIGYWTAPAARGRGLAAAAVDAVAGWAFAALPIDRIELLHGADNVASARVAHKAGFTHEAHLRRSHRYGDGRKHDEWLWGRLADDPGPETSRPG